MSELDYNKVENKLIGWLQKKISEAGASGAVLGLSGGIDSSVTAVLAQKAFGKNVLGVIMPCHSNQSDAADAKLLAEKFAIDFVEVDLGDTYNKLLSDLNQASISDNDLARANIKPRLRMTSLYYYAASLNYLVLGTDNWSELTTGYFTKYGDGGIDLAPLGRLVKTEVRELARHLGIPEKLINKKPSAGLWQGQSDEEEMGISYAELDHYILTGEADSAVEARIAELSTKSAHKLQPIPIPERELITE